MRVSFLKWSSILSLASVAFSSPVFRRGQHHDCGQLSKSRPSKGYGQAKFGDYSNFAVQSNDVNILQFALMLEIAQTLFYDQGFSQFSVEEMLSVGLSETEIVELQNGAIVEQTHVDTIVQVLASLNVQPLNQPQFFFQFSSPVDFVEQLSVQEVIGTGAYLGAAPLVDSKDILSSAASIMATEARQSSFVNSVLGDNAFTSAFETPLSIEQVVTLVAPAIANLPQGTVLDALGFNPSSFGLEELSVSSFEQVSIGSTLNFSYLGGDEITPPSGHDQLYCAYSVGSNTFYEQYVPSHGCHVSNSLSSGNVVVIQVTISESIDISQCISAPQFIRIV